MNAQNQHRYNSFTDEQISVLLKQHRENTISEAAGLAMLRKAAVLVPLFFYHSNWHLLFTRRTDFVNDHKGQVSFPGGAMDPLDSTLEDTAQREAFEEIGLLPADITPMGRMSEMPARSGFLITPVVSRIRWPFKQTLSTNEVSRVFTIPLHWLAQSNNRRKETIHIQGQQVDGVLFFTPYDGEVLWGITAQITVDLLNILGLSE